MIIEAARRASVVVCGWRNPGALGGRDKVVLQLLRDIGIKPYALKFNKNGTPKHPLYVVNKTIPIEMVN